MSLHGHLAYVRRMQYGSTSTRALRRHSWLPARQYVCLCAGDQARQLVVAVPRVRCVVLWQCIWVQRPVCWVRRAWAPGRVRSRSRVQARPSEGTHIEVSRQVRGRGRAKTTYGASGRPGRGFAYDTIRDSRPRTADRTASSAGELFKICPSVFHCCFPAGHGPPRTRPRAMDPIFAWFGVAAAAGTGAMIEHQDRSDFDGSGRRCRALLPRHARTLAQNASRFLR